MSRKRDRASTIGLLPRMEARPWSDGKTITYRFHPVGGKPINLGTDKAEAIRQVASMNGSADDSGTIGALWKDYKASNDWKNLAERTRFDYEQYSKPLLAVFGDTPAATLTAPMVARYLRKERKDAGTRANREVSLLGNLMSLAIERGEAEHNPCRGGQVKRNKERPRPVAPEADQIAALVAHAMKMGGQYRVVVMAAEYAALAGNRKAEFLGLHWTQVGEDEIRLMRAKQHGGTVRVEQIKISPALRALLERLRPLAHDDRVGAVFPNRAGNPYTSSGFNSMWQKLMRDARKEKAVVQQFTFHDLRAYYVTTHKTTTGDLPDMHASPTTTARVYERSRVSKRSAL